jgi:hypothetical protein
MDGALQRGAHALEFILGLPIPLPPVARITLPEEIHAAGARAVEEEVEALLVQEQAAEIVVISMVTHIGMTHVASLLVAHMAIPTDAGQARGRAGANEGCEGAAAGRYMAGIVLAEDQEGWG